MSEEKRAQITHSPESVLAPVSPEGEDRETAGEYDPDGPARVRRALQERMRELACLRGVIEVMRGGRDLPAILRDLVARMSTGWGALAIASVRIVFDGRSHVWHVSEATPWKLFSDIVAAGRRRGFVEVCLQGCSGRLDGWAVSKEKQGLVDTVAGMIGNWFDAAHGRHLGETWRGERKATGALQKASRQEVLACQRRLRDLAMELSLAEERERNRVAAALHDQVSQDLVAAKLRVDLLKNATPSEEQRNALSVVQKLLDRAVGGLASLTQELCPPLLHEAGLEEALKWLVELFNEKARVRFHFVGDGQSGLLGTEVRGLLFQIVRELLTNVVKHARAARATVIAKALPGEVRITVEDDGAGFDPQLINCGDGTSSFGLLSIRERLRHLGGQLEMEAQPVRGSRITVIMPL